MVLAYPKEVAVQITECVLDLEKHFAVTFQDLLPLRVPLIQVIKIGKLVAKSELREEVKNSILPFEDVGEEVKSLN